MSTPNRQQLVPELACSDAHASKAFYVDTLGFTVLYERPEQGFFYLVRDAAEIMIEQVSKNTWVMGELTRPFGRGMHFQIMTVEIEALYNRCKSAGANIFKEMEEAWYRAGDEYVGQRQFVVVDPDGFMLRFAEDLGRQTEPPKSGRSVA